MSTRAGSENQREPSAQGFLAIRTSPTRRGHICKHKNQTSPKHHEGWNFSSSFILQPPPTSTPPSCSSLPSKPPRCGRRLPRLSRTGDMWRGRVVSETADAAEVKGYPLCWRACGREPGEGTLQGERARRRILRPLPLLLIVEGLPLVTCLAIFLIVKCSSIIQRHPTFLRESHDLDNPSVIVQSSLRSGQGYSSKIVRILSREYWVNLMPLLNRQVLGSVDQGSESLWCLYRFPDEIQILNMHFVKPSSIGLGMVEGRYGEYGRAWSPVRWRNWVMWVLSVVDSLEFREGKIWSTWAMDHLICSLRKCNTLPTRSLSELDLMFLS